MVMAVALAIPVSSTFKQQFCTPQPQKTRKKFTLFANLMPQTNCRNNFHIFGNTASKGIRKKLIRKPVKETMKLSLLKEALEILYLSEQPRSWLDTSVYVSLLQACIDLKAIIEGLCIHAHMIKVGFKPSIFLNNILLSMFVKFGRLRDARQVFDKMPQKNKVSWTTLIAGYAQNGFDEEAVELFSAMHCEGLKKPSVVTFVAAIRAMAAMEALELGRQVHGYIVKSGCEVNLFLESALVDFYGRCGSLEDAFHMFDKMPERDVVAWTALIAVCAKQGHGKEAIRLFCEMQCEGGEVNEFTVASVLKACAELKGLKEGKQVHGVVIRSKVRQDVYVYSGLIDMYVKCGCVVEACKVFDRIQEHNNVSWTTMIAGYAQNGFGEEAIELFRAMQREGMEANNFTFVSILKACGVIRALKQGKEVHAQIIKRKYELNAHLLSTLVALYAKCGDLAYAGKVFSQMPAQDVVAWTAMIAGHVEQEHGEEALALLVRMLQKGIKPNEFTFTSSLRACARIEALEEGKQIHGSINKTQFGSNVFVGSALMEMYSNCGSLANAHNVFDRMPERNEVCWNVIIEGYISHGYCKKALELLYQMHQSGMNPEQHIILSVLDAYGKSQSNASNTSSICSEISPT